ncbi:hypothetical protein Pan258_34960 [Symmachiella dynata]|nr:hypothetical protein Pan258_34960 [Symmachiella dynata]
MTYCQRDSPLRLCDKAHNEDLLSDATYCEIIHLQMLSDRKNYSVEDLHRSRNIVCS